MRYFKIIRIAFLADGTFGVFLDDTIPFALTLELPWKNNEPFISCIPAGFYICKRVKSERFGETFEVQKVPDRDKIRFHWGNIDDDTEGCILTGEMFEPLGEHNAIRSSRYAFREFMARTEGIDFFSLTIEEHKTDFQGDKL